MVAFSVVFVLMDVHLQGLMRLVVLECVGFKRTEEDCGFLAISVRLASYIRPVIIGKQYFVDKSSFQSTASLYYSERCKTHASPPAGIFETSREEVCFSWSQALIIRFKSCLVYLMQSTEGKSKKKPCRTENTLFLRLCIQTITTTTRISIYSNSCFLIGLDVISEHNTPFISLLWCSLFFEKGPVAQWIRHLTTNQGIPGSNPGGVAVILSK